MLSNPMSCPLWTTPKDNVFNKILNTKKKVPEMPYHIKVYGLFVKN